MALRMIRAAKPSRRRERRFGGAVGDQFDRAEQPAAADVADMGVIAEALVQTAREPLALATTLSRRWSRRITCCTASAAAQGIGWPI